MSDDPTPGQAPNAPDSPPPAPAPGYDAPPAPAPAYGAPPAPGYPPGPPAYRAPTPPPGYAAPPAAPGYGAPAYNTTPSYAAPGYSYTPYPTAAKTNTLAIVSMIASIVGFLWILPFIGSLAGAIMGHLSLSQLRKTGEKGRGMALAGVIVGWAGVALFVIIGIFIIWAISWSAMNEAQYRT